jgi:hypothetical protein
MLELTSDVQWRKSGPRQRGATRRSPARRRRGSVRSGAASGAPPRSHPIHKEIRGDTHPLPCQLLLEGRRRKRRRTCSCSGIALCAPAIPVGYTYAAGLRPLPSSPEISARRWAPFTCGNSRVFAQRTAGSGRMIVRKTCDRQSPFPFHSDSGLVKGIVSSLLFLFRQCCNHVSRPGRLLVSTRMIDCVVPQKTRTRRSADRRDENAVLVRAKLKRNACG